MAVPRPCVQNQVCEWSYSSGKAYADPFNELGLDMRVDGPGGTWRVPAYWAGGQEWRVRFSPPAVGLYRCRTVCSDATNGDLHDQQGQFQASAYEGDNPLLRHGAVHVAPDRKHFQHADGTPFFWLGDTWWMSLTGRLGWPEDFQRLTADRKAKGFTVVQLVAGLFPDMPAFDERGANEAGQAWEADFAAIRPAWYDLADLKIQWLVREGLVPCVFPCWGYYLPWMGVEKMKKHWRYLVARWGAYPVIWSLAGEATMPWYLDSNAPHDSAELKEGWTELGRYLRQVDPYRRMVTIHPIVVARDSVLDDSVIDFDMLQTGHSGPPSFPRTMKFLLSEQARQPTMPVMIGEVNYENLVMGNSDEVQRLTFWGCMLSGAPGHTYGANGLFQVNTPTQQMGRSPHGCNWGDTLWTDAMNYPGSSQLGLGAKLLQEYPWHRFQPHQDWIEPAANAKNWFGAFAAGIPGQVRIIYLYQPIRPWEKTRTKVVGLERDVQYRAFYFDPRTGVRTPLGPVQADASGAWPIPGQPIMKDFVLVLERV